MNNLPDSVVEEILSNLDMKQVIQTSVLSPRWRNLWKSVPDLRFSRWLWNLPGDGDQNKKAMNFVDRVLLLRDNAANIRRFHLYGHCSSDYHNQILTFLTQTSTLGVKQIHLSIYSSFRHLHEFPGIIFTSPVQEFELISRRSGESFSMVILPKSLYLAHHLRVLVLKTVILPESDSNSMIVFSSPVLQTLVLNQCRIGAVKVVDICCPHLKKLKLNHVYSDVVAEIRIRTPQLRSLGFCGFYRIDYYLENLSSLVSCCIGESKHYSCIKSLHTTSFMRILNQVCSAVTLTTHGSWNLAQPSNNSSDPPLKQFVNLKCLKLLRFGSDSSIWAVANILMNSHCIETIVWESGAPTYHIDPIENEDWEADFSLQITFYQMKYIDVRNLRATQNELKFIRFLLRNALVLEKIKITFSRMTWRNPENIARMEEEINRFSEEVQSLPKASATASIIFG